MNKTRNLKALFLRFPEGFALFYKSGLQGLMLLFVSVAVLVLVSPAFAGSVAPTGQTTCYDDQGNVIDPCPEPGEPFYGQDADYEPNLQSFTKLDY